MLNGVKQKGTHDDVAYKTDGIVTAITSITADAAGTDLTYWAIAALIKDLSDEAPTEQLVLMARGENIMQLNADAQKNNMTIVPSGRSINGIAINLLITPFGDIGILKNNFLPEGVAVIVNPSVCAPVYMPVPGKGNFFLEQLAQRGAGETCQHYGTLG